MKYTNFTDTEKTLAMAINAFIKKDLRNLFEEIITRPSYNYPVFFPQQILFGINDLEFFGNDPLSLGDVFEKNIGKDSEIENKVMIAISELGIHYLKVSDLSSNLSIEDILYFTRIENLFSFISKLSDTDYDGTIIEDILEFIETANEFLIGPYKSIHSVSVGDVFLKANFVYKTTAFAETLFNDNEDKYESLVWLRKEATRLMSKIILLIYQVCFKDKASEFYEIISDFADSLSEKTDENQKQ